MKRFWLLLGIWLALYRTNSAGNLAISELPPCPPRWVTMEESCYWFEQGAVTNWKTALSSCQQIGAKLISLNDLHEAQFVAKHLKAVDHTRKDWLTSSIFANGAWEWQGDGSQLNFLFWMDEDSPPPAQEHIAFTYSDNEYRWKTVSGSSKLPYICEVSRLSLWDVYRKLRPPEFLGRSPEGVFDKPHHPVLIEEPENVVYFGEEGPKTFISLKCGAFGRPQPSISWFKGAGGIPVELDENSRLLQVDGSLVFLKVTGRDFDSYYCVAINEFGSVRSRRIVLNHAYTKEFPETRLDVYATGGIGKSILCEEPDHFPQSLGYGWMFESVKKFVRESARVYISQDGSLYFSYLEKEDETSYSCNIVSSELQTGHYGPFFNLRIADAEAGIAEKYSPKIPEEFLKMNPSEPELGGDVWLECFAYARPTATYAWTRRNGHLPMKARLRNYGRVLYIPRFESDDIGIYQCKARNQLGSDTKTVTLDFKSRPKFVTDLKDQFQEANSSVFFFCKAFGRPKVDYEWFHNGSPISPLLLPPDDQTRISIDNNRLIILNLQPRDAGIYQCLASNSLGQKMSSGYLAVKNFRPSFSKQIRNKFHYGISGESVDVYCEVEASPKPSISWRKNGFPVKYNDRISPTDSGILRIKDASTLDSGDYTCTATNEYGSDTNNIGLNILAKNLNLDVTESLVMSRGKNRTLTCSLNNSCNSKNLFNCPEFAYSWTFNGESVTSLPQFQTGYSTNSLEISEFPLTSVSTVHSGTYMCRVDFPSGHLSRSVSVRVRSVPLSPVRVGVHSPTRNSVKISWKLPLNSQGAYEGDMDAYRIEALMGNDTEWHVVSERLNTFHPEVKDFELVGLRSYTMYKFRVSSHNMEGWSVPSLPSQAIRTESSKPHVAVTGLSVSSPNIGDILVLWQPLPSERWGDDHLGYVVEWEEENNKSSSQSDGDTRKSVSLGMGASTSYVIPIPENNGSTSAAPCRVFVVKVCPFNSHGRGPMAGPYKLGVSRSAPERSPKEFLGKALNSTHVQFSWIWRHSNHHIGCETAIMSFKVSCASRESKSVSHLVESKDERSNITVGGFYPSVRYECSIAALGTGALSGPPANVDVLLLKSAPKEAPKDVKVVSTKDEEHLHLHWSEVPDQLNVQEKITGYKLFLFHGGSASASQEFNIPISLLHSSKFPMIRLKGLHSLQLYRAQIGAYSQGGMGPLSQPLTFRFGLSAASGTLMDLKTFFIVLLVSLCFHLNS